MIKFNAIPVKPGQHAAADPQPAKRFEVFADGAKIGEVYTTSRESRTGTGNGRLLGRLRGYTRTWQGTNINGERVVWTANSRQAAGEQLREAR